MELNSEVRGHVAHVAHETLATLERVAEIAASNLQSPQVLTAGSLATVNTLTSFAAVQSLNRINADAFDSNRQLLREPAIARIVATDESGKSFTYYICRTTPPNGTGLASYRSPVGRLASLDIGETFALPNSVLEVRERALLRPINNDGWDSRDSVLEGDAYGPVTVESMRALFARRPPLEDDADLLEKLLAAEGEAENVREGIRRSVINKMGLRDQPTLDKYQDEIFRLPLNSQLLILGPPGTGKTTTLIRRLGQKLDVAYLSREEQSSIEISGSSSVSPHHQSWLMFTPTDLLKQYVKEAFAREGIPASDQRIRTWADYRREIARNVLGILRAATGSGTFVLKEGADFVSPQAIESSKEWFTDFDGWNRSAFFAEIQAAATELAASAIGTAASIGARSLKLMEGVDATEVEDFIEQLSEHSAATQNFILDLKAGTDEKVRSALNLQVNRNRAFLNELASFMDVLKDLTSADADDPEDIDADEEEDEIATAKTGPRAAADAYMRAIRAQARAVAKKRNLSKTSRNGRIIDWLGDRGLSSALRTDVGTSLLVQASARNLVNSAKRYVERIPRRYRDFRRLRVEEGLWYRAGTLPPSDLHPLELDLILLTVLRSTRRLLRRRAVAAAIDQADWSALRPVRDLFRNQILVDEATDFSPLQIACMAALANPAIGSFFACGDFNQRLTIWGSRTIADMEWGCPGIVNKSISVSYRQSRQLNELAKAIVQVSGGGATAALLPEHVDNEGVQPVLGEGLKTATATTEWLTARISEIESLLHQLPSIAILVLEEAEVQPIADELGALLADKNIRVVACHDGQSLGQENDVRVFDIKHIKGLEFEAAFFVGIDKLATNQPTLFDKYLYVGTTRAAVYLGVTCEGPLPAGIEALRPMFGSAWA